MLDSTHKLSLNNHISLKFIWHVTINKIQVELFEKRGHLSIWTGVMALDRCENWKIFGYCSIARVLMMKYDT